MPWADSFLHQLQEHCGADFKPIRSAYENSERELKKLSAIVRNLLPDEASFVVFGSFARKEVTTGSDLDWSLIIDGQVDPAHRKLEQALKQELTTQDFKSPNPAGAFGAIVFGHELVHCIGGNDDTNANLTRRQLLLLESAEPARPEPHPNPSPRARVIHAVLARYFEEDAYFKDKPFFPRFFLNDVVRYWRTIAVDYAAKNRERGGDGWALRNTKLRFSRKLLYIAGLLLTYESDLFSKSEHHPVEGQRLSDEALSELQFSGVQQCFSALQLTPLELLARSCLKLELPRNDLTVIFQSYGKFLEILDSEEMRKELSGLTFQSATTNSLFQEVRDLSHEFQAHLSKIFMDPQNEIGRLTIKYGVF